MRSPIASQRLVVGTTTLLVWALAAGSALYWGLRASGAQGQAVPPAAGIGQAVTVDTEVVARALGAKGPASGATAAPDVVSRLALRGVVTHDGRGAALIAVSDKPAKPFRVGAEVEGGWTLKSVSPRAASDHQRYAGGYLAHACDVRAVQYQGRCGAARSCASPGTAFVGAHAATGAALSAPGFPLISTRAYFRNSRYAGLFVSSTHG
ncbi:type II secretion system protein N [Ottowia sp. VDI28]|uniref:type II secretion system protein N n=1 Tax=Ottowia sp. VDI28 TaxID=3133968 RepID=UPI003C2E2AE2